MANMWRDQEETSQMPWYLCIKNLQNYYNDINSLYYGQTDKDRLTYICQYLSNYCNIKLEKYEEAITWFEGVIADPPTYADSVYAVIDLGYTYLLMQGETILLYIEWFRLILFKQKEIIIVLK